MIQNYLKIALRNLLRNKVYSFINIAGLALGLTVSMLILLFVMHEISFDKFHTNGDRVYKVSAEVKYGEQVVNMDHLNAKLAPLIKQNNPEVLDFVRVNNLGEVIFKNVQNPTQKFKESNFLFVDKSFFSVFSYKIKEGNMHSVFQNPFSIVISEKVAKKYFGNENPIGKTLQCNLKHLFTVTGIMENIPSNSTNTFDFLTSIETYPKLGKEQKSNWEGAGAFETYLFLNSEKSVPKVTKSILVNGKKTGAFDEKATYSLIQYSTQHLTGGFSGNTNAKYAYIFGGVALLILFLALFNYMSLTTARATTRAKEVGIRKVVGGDRNGLIQQFYIESILICSIAFVLAFVLIQLLLQPFYDLAGVQIDASFINSPTSILAILGLFIICVFLAGSYPALLLSRFKPIEVIKGKYTSGQGGARFRKGITIFQYTVSCILIICVIITQRQINYLKNKDLGFSKAQILAIPVDSSMAKNFINLKNDLRQMAGVKSIASATTPLFKGFNGWFTNSLRSKKQVMLCAMSVDNNFFKTVDLRWKIVPNLKDGLNKKIFINELAVKQLEIEGSPVRQLINLGDGKLEVGGVLKDFNFTGLKEKIQPLMITAYDENSTAWVSFSGNRTATIYLRFEPTVILEEKVAIVNAFYDKYKSEKSFEYYFLNEAYNETFKAEMRLSTMMSLFSGFAIFIACMGLFGLIAFAAETRTKEIGIRKVLGASVSQIVGLLSKDFLILVFVSILIASPIAYYFMQKWLQDFAFRIEISWWIFALSGFVALLIALLTVSYQAIKAAVANPVKSLRTE